MCTMYVCVWGTLLQLFQLFFAKYVVSSLDHTDWLSLIHKPLPVNNNNMDISKQDLFLLLIIITYYLHIHVHVV